MNTATSSALWVKCPHCGNRFTPEEAIGHDLRIQIEKEFNQKLSEHVRTVEERTRRQEREQYQAQLHQLEEDRKSKVQRLKVLEDAAVKLQQRELDVQEREERMEIEMKKRLVDREKLIREQAEKMALEKALLEVREKEHKLQQDREMMEVILKKRVLDAAERARAEESLKLAELQKKLDDQNKLIHEMKRKSEQGSMQLQGEVQELAIEEFLRNTFPRDTVEEVSKGKRGGDCVHIVADQYQNVCGRVLYESKRTKHFSHEWLSKIKEDMRLQQADVAVLVTEAFPEGMSRFGLMEGVWVCSFVEFKALAVLFRHNLCRIGEILTAQENKGDKMQLIYRYVTSNEFRQKLEAAFEAHREMQEDLLKEKALLTSQWAKREKRMLKAMENLVALYGDVRGIAGGAVQEIKGLEIPDVKVLFEP